MIELSNVSPKVYFAHYGDKSESKLPDNVRELPGINHVNQKGEFVFENGFKATIDVFIPCTGYSYDFPFLTQECEIKVKENGRIVAPLYKHLIHINILRWFFLGYSGKLHRCQ